MTTPDSQYPLNQLYFYLTQGCNLACRHCWLAPKFDPQGDRYPTLPVDLFAEIIRQARPLGLQGVKLTGGEPLLHPHFSDLLDILHEQELGLTIETNGLLCTPEIAARIARFPRRFISVSLDGADASTHEWVRGVAGSFDLACQAVRTLSDAGLRPQVILSLMPHNVHQVEAVVRLAESLGAASVKFNIVQPTARGEKLHQAGDVLDVAELIRLGRYVELDLSKTTPLRLFFHYPPAFRPLSAFAHAGNNGTCGILGILGVLPDGAYALCGIGEQIPELVFGQADQDALGEVWINHPTLEALRTGLPGQLEGICAGCLMKAACLGDCIAQNYYRTGSLWAPFWFCEAAAEQGLFPASRRLS